MSQLLKKQIKDNDFFNTSETMVKIGLRDTLGGIDKTFGYFRRNGPFYVLCKANKKSR